MELNEPKKITNPHQMKPGKLYYQKIGEYEWLFDFKQVFYEKYRGNGIYGNRNLCIDDRTFTTGYLNFFEDAEELREATVFERKWFIECMKQGKYVHPEEIPGDSEFRVGDTVVFESEKPPDHLITDTWKGTLIGRVDGLKSGDLVFDCPFPNSNRNDTKSNSSRCFRHATKDEIERYEKAVKKYGKQMFDLNKINNDHFMNDREKEIMTLETNEMFGLRDRSKKQKIKFKDLKEGDVYVNFFKYVDTTEKVIFKIKHKNDHDRSCGVVGLSLLSIKHEGSEESAFLKNMHLVNNGDFYRADTLEKGWLLECEQHDEFIPFSIYVIKYNTHNTYDIEDTKENNEEITVEDVSFEDGDSEVTFEKNDIVVFEENKTESFYITDVWNGNLIGRIDDLYTDSLGNKSLEFECEFPCRKDIQALRKSNFAKFFRFATPEERNKYLANERAHGKKMFNLDEIMGNKNYNFYEHITSARYVTEPYTYTKNPCMEEEIETPKDKESPGHVMLKNEENDIEKQIAKDYKKYSRMSTDDVLDEIISNKE